MATLETQYRNYMEENPLSEFTFDQWKEYHGRMIVQAIKPLISEQTRIKLVQKMNTQSEFELTYEEINFIVENWLSVHTQHKLKKFQISKTDITAQVVLNKDLIFKN